MHSPYLLKLTELFISFNGWGVTRDDSLDTMLLMNLTDMFDRAMLGVKELTFDMKEVREFIHPSVLAYFPLPAVFGRSDIVPR